MTPPRSLALAAGAVVALALAACGEASGPVTQAGFHWWPSTPLPTPAPAGASPTPSASASASATPASAGQGAASGLGTPAETVSATANLSFSPNTTTAKVGDVVQWTNTGNVPHNVTFSDPTLTSGTLNQNDTWQVKITVAGTYAYKCTFHPGMTGTLTVTG